MAVNWAWCGAPTESTFRVNASVTGTAVQLAVSENDAFDVSILFGPATPNANGIVTLTATGLSPERPYHWRLVVDDAPDDLWTGRATTHREAGRPYSFTFAAAGDAGSGDVETVVDQVSNRGVFSTIREHNPLFFVHLGDIHYRNITSGDPADYRAGYADSLTFNGTRGHEAEQGRLYRNVPTVYVWDDHDYSGNDSDGTYSGKLAASEAFRECVPHYPMIDSEAIFQEFIVGRVQFVLLDSRYYRSPNDAPNDSSKTLLGASQLAWLEGVLASSTAEALIIVTPVQWMSNFQDSWGSFSFERDQIAGMLSQYGWLDRMCLIQADKHSLGIDTGTNNQWGGFPNYLFASMDSNPSPSPATFYDLGDSPGRDQYGLVHVEDTGDQITINGVGYRDSSVLRSHSFVIQTSDNGGGDDGGNGDVPDETPGVYTPRVTWLGCDLVSGRIITELPDITGTISRVLGSSTDTSLTLPIPLSGPASMPPSIWQQATAPGRSMLVAVVNDVPAWAGIIMKRTGGTEGTLGLSCMTLEAYLDWRFVSDHTWTLRDEARIAADLVADAQPDGIGFIVDAPSTGTLRDRQYHHTDDATVYSRLRELSEVENGPEWTIDVEWADEDRTAIAKIFRLRKRIGREAGAPDAVFQTTAGGVFSSESASESTYQYTEDYSNGKGANYIIATGSGEGEDRPESRPIADVRQGWPRYERRISPSTSISKIATLDDHARKELALLRDGTKTFDIRARWDTYPRMNIDWRLGDDVAWHLKGHRHPPPAARRVPVTGPAEISVVGTSAAGTGGATDISLPWPTGVQAGDTALLWWSTSTTSGQPAAPSGFQLVESVTGTGSHLASLYLRACDGTETGSITATSGAENKHSATLTVYRGTHADPISDARQRQASTETGTHPCPLVTVAHPGTVLVSAYQERQSAGTTSIAPPTAFSLRAETGNLAEGGGGTFVATADNPTTPGQVSPGSWTGGVPTDNAVTWSVALRPATVTRYQTKYVGNDGVRGQGRVIGWDLDVGEGLVTPILYDESEG